MIKQEIIEIIGGLGNQMFQYAFALNMQKEFPNHAVKLCLKEMQSYTRHNGYELDRIFTIRLPHTGYALNRILKKGFIRKKLVKQCIEATISEISTPKRSRLKPVHYYRGYWQSEKYFSMVKTEMHDVFNFNESLLSDKTKQMAYSMQSTRSVSLHVRRGDYVSNSEAHAVHGGICTIYYYELCIKKMRELLGDNIQFYLFSDDVEWVKANISIPDACVINWNCDKDSWQDMYLMSRCKHHIIANSSFSWWGAWLNPNPDKIVLAPSRWFNTMEAPLMLPKKWIQVAVD